MILLTGAAGKTGLAALGQLSMHAVPVRALVHKAEYENAVRSAGAEEVICGDLRDTELIRVAFAGVNSVYHIPPNMSPDEFEIGRLVVSEARQQEVGHFVYHSVLHPHVEAMPHHWEKMRVEEFLFASGLDFTILQPSAYIQNILAQWDSIQTEGCFQMPYPVKTRLSLVDLRDVAEAAVIVLTQEEHRNAIYELVGTKPLSQLEVADLLGQLLEQEVRADTIPIKLWRQNAVEAGLDRYAVETLVKMFEYYAAYGFHGNTSVLGWLLGRAPTSFEQAIKRERNL
jgi:uncharacterized protein YbjT (DUF2867 family)